MQPAERGVERQPAQGPPLEKDQLVSGQTQAAPRLLGAQADAVANLDHPALSPWEPLEGSIDRIRHEVPLDLLVRIDVVGRHQQAER